jgi:IS30 family transposase
MLGCSGDEVATRLGCVTRTVERELARMRRMWAWERRD